MKLIVFITKVIVTAIVAVLFSSCKFDVDLGPGLTGDGNVITDTRNNDIQISGIEVSRGLDVEVELSSEQSIAVVADKNLQDHISTDINNGILTITCDENIKEATSKKVIVKMRSVTSLQASSASQIIGKNVMKGQNIDLSTSSAGEINVSLEAETVSAESSSGSNMKLHGKVLKLETDSSSGSVIDAKDLLANDVISEASSGSSTDVKPLVSIKAKASSGSSISYHGDPKIVSKTASSGGSVSKE